MSNLVLSIFLSSPNPSEEKQKNSSLFVLYSSLNLSQVLHQDFDLTAITELDDTLFANLANTLTGKVELATDFLQTLLVAAYTIAVAQNLALTVFQYRVENAVKLARHRLEVNTLVGTAVITRSHHVDHRIVIIIATEWSIDTHVVIICLDSLVDFAFFHLCDLSELSNRRFALVLLLKLTDFCTNLTQCTYLVQRQANDTALLGNSLLKSLTRPAALSLSHTPYGGFVRASCRLLPSRAVSFACL